MFEHSLIECDVFLELRFILASLQHYSLSETEQQVLAIDFIVHDVGKETQVWQFYVSGKGASVTYVLVADIVPTKRELKGYAVAESKREEAKAQRIIEERRQSVEENSISRAAVMRCTGNTE